MKEWLKKVYTIKELVAIDERWYIYIILTSENEKYKPNKVREKLHSYIVDKLIKNDYGSVRLKEIFNNDELDYIYKKRYILKLK